MLLICCGLILWLILPRYQDYVLISKVDSSLESSQQFQEMMMHYYQVYGVFPMAADLYMGKGKKVSSIGVPYVSEVEIVGGKPSNAKLILTMDSQALGVEGSVQAIYSLQKTKTNGYRWSCILKLESENRAFINYAPKACHKITMDILKPAIFHSGGL